MKLYNNIEEMKKDYYVASDMNKSAGAIASSTAGVHNTVFGEAIWTLVNTKSNVFGAIPKVPFVRTGFRVITTGLADSEAAGIAEGASIRAIAASKPDFAEGNFKLKEVYHKYEITGVDMVLANSDDDHIALQEVRDFAVEDFKTKLEKQLLANTNVVAGLNLESIDRVASSQAEETLNAVAGSSDIYGWDRSGSTLFDATVSHASGVDRAFTEDLLRELVDDIEEASGDVPNLIITGKDTKRKLDAALATNTRYSNEKMTVSLGEGGIIEGVDFGSRVSQYDGIPVLTSRFVVKDTGSRVYALNTNYLKINVAKPVEVAEFDGLQSNDSTGKIGHMSFMGELVCTKPSAQGKIRDLL